jgi:hypothetical protein
MKKFPAINFDLKAEDQTQNLKNVIESILTLREDGHAWKVIEGAYKTSKYAEHLGWAKVYKAASAAEKVAVPPPVKPEKVKTESKKQPENSDKPKKEIELVNINEHFPQLSAEKYKLLKELIIKDLQSKDSVLMSEIIARLEA